MKVERCNEQITVTDPLGGGHITRYCLLEAGHEKAQEYFGPGHPRKVPRPHEFAPICEGCGQVKPASPGDQSNLRKSC